MSEQTLQAKRCKNRKYFRYGIATRSGSENYNVKTITLFIKNTHTHNNIIKIIRTTITHKENGDAI